ncbi:hypothetical protein JRQ81_005198, partial [Phrynocephalus forsythii]
HADSTPLTRYQFVGVIQKALHMAGYEPGASGTHSFQIGAASQEAVQGLSRRKIKKVGTWASNAYKAYARTTDKG